jgi:uncharacterized caspase-like protein
MPQSAAPATSVSQKRALLVGVDYYEYFPGSSLHGCVNDIAEIQKLLVQHAGFPETNIRTLISPSLGLSVPPPLTDDLPIPTGAKILEAFDRLIADCQAGDEVFVYYSGHGVRVSNPQQPQEHIFGWAPSDTQANGQGLLNLVTNYHLNGYGEALLAKSVQLTMIVDACHSGGGLRGLDTAVRELELPKPTQGEWDSFQAALPQPGTPATPTTRGMVAAWIQPGAGAEEWVVLAACRNDQKARELDAAPPLPAHGALTAALLSALQAAPTADATQLRWNDLYPQVQQNLARQVGDQLPQLEGRGEAPIFGGKWSPYAPGFAADPSAANPGLAQVAAGTLQGLDIGAEVAIYPPDTADFAAYEATGAPRIVGQVVKAAPVVSWVQLPDGAAVAPRSRARLLRPSPAAPRLGVDLTALPASVVAAVGAVPTLRDFVNVTPTDGRLQDEVIPATQVAVARGSAPWASQKEPCVLVPYTSPRKPLSTNDVIAWLPGLADFDGKADAFGLVLGQALIGWARYVAVRDQTNTDDTLGKLGIVQATLLAGPDKTAMQANPSDRTAAQSVALQDGSYRVQQDQYLLVEVRVRAGAPWGVFVGLLLCSDDGNTVLLWPTPGAQPLFAGVHTDDDRLPEEDQVRYVFNRGPYPARLQIRGDQTASRYKLKLFAYTVSGQQETVDLTGLEQKQTVQEVIDAGVKRTRGGLITKGNLDEEPQKVEAPVMLWTTIDLPVEVYPLPGPAGPA